MNVRVLAELWEEVMSVDIDRLGQLKLMHRLHYLKTKLFISPLSSCM